MADTKISEATLILDRYDTGLLGDGGGGDVNWWQDYIRSELERAHEFYQDQADNLHPQPAALNEVSGNYGGLGGQQGGQLVELAMVEKVMLAHAGKNVTSYVISELRPLAATDKQAGEVQRDARALLREVCAELDALDCGACTGSMAPMEDLHGRIVDHLADRQPVAHRRNPLLAYADSYKVMASMGDGRVSASDVAFDIEKNMAPHAAPLAQGIDSDAARERDLLAAAIIDAAVKSGIYRAHVPMSGPQLLMACDDMAECIKSAQGIDFAPLRRMSDAWRSKAGPQGNPHAEAKADAYGACARELRDLIDGQRGAAGVGNG